MPTKPALRRASALVYGSVTLVVVAFQFALAAGAPWGEYAMGGASSGQLSPALRIGAVIQAALLVAMAAIVAARAGLALPGWLRRKHWLIWPVLGVATVTLVLNLITPSARERAIWAPAGFLLALTSAFVAFAGPPDQTRRSARQTRSG